MLGKRFSAMGAALLISCGQLSAIEQVSGINQITFHDEQYSKPFAGNGFLIEYRKKVYAVTVKHTLLEARTPDMLGVRIAEHVSGWQIHPNQLPQQSVELGKLLNSDAEEKLDMGILQKDWLIFEVKNNNSNLAVLTLRSTPLVKGETLSAYGCSYANAESCQQDTYTGQFISNVDANLRMSLDNMEFAQLRGLSGSPVLDENNQVVGIVSNILPSESSEGFDFAPANLDYLIEVLSTL